MIKLIDRKLSPAISALINDQATLMSQGLNDVMSNTVDTRKQLLTDSIINFFTIQDNPYALAFGHFDNAGKLRAMICVTFSYMIPAWNTSYVFSNYNTTEGAIVTFNLIKEVIKFAESRGYYQYYTVVEKERADSYDKLFKRKMKTEYLTAVDEVVPAHKRPINDLFWGWLYESRCKDVDTVVVNHWLPREHRTFISN
jgi:hypothetical protein